MDSIAATIDDQTRSIQAGIGWQPGENIGTGAEVYADTNLGTMQFRTLVATDATVALVQNVDTIGFSAQPTQDALDAHKVSVTDHTDVVTTTPQNIDSLTYAGGNWVNRRITSDDVPNKAGAGGPTVTDALDDLSAATGVVQSNLDTHKAALDDHTDVTETTPQDLDSLVYNTGVWINQRLTSDDVPNNSTVTGATTSDALERAEETAILALSSLANHEADQTNPHVVQSNQVGNNSTISGTFVSDALDTHQATVGDHTDVTLITQASGQMLVSDGTKLGNTVTLGAANGVCPLGADGKVPSIHSPSGATLKGAWDAATNDPDLANLAGKVNGDYWIVDVAGNTDLGNVTDQWQIGDWALYSTDEPGNWIRVAVGTQVSSVFGRTGAVVAGVNDYNSNQIVNASTVPGVNVSASLDSLQTLGLQNQSDLAAHEADTANPHSTTVSNLTDTTILTPAIDQALVYDGAGWVNYQLNSVQILDASIVGGPTVQDSLQTLHTSTTTNAGDIATIQSTYLPLAGGDMTGPIGLSQTAPAHTEGLLFYDGAEHTAAYYNDETEMTVNVGQEIIARVRNPSAGAFSDGQAVYVSGSIGNRPTVALAQADTEATSRVFGVVTAPIGNNEDGYTTCYGGVGSVNTTSWSEGDILYLSDSTPGALTNTPPARAVQVAVVLKSAVQGKLFVSPSRSAIAENQIATHLSDFGNPHQTTIANLSDTTTDAHVGNQVLQSDGAQWINGMLNSFQVPDASSVGGGDVEASLGILNTTSTNNTNNIATHRATVGDHTDVLLSTVEAGDLLINTGTQWVNAVSIDGFRGTIGADTTVALGTQVAWTEIVPGTVIQAEFKNVSYNQSTGRLKIDYSANPQPATGNCDGRVEVSMSVETPTSDTLFEVSFAVDGVPIPGADVIRAVVSNVGQQAAGTIQAVSFFLPLLDPVDTELSVVYRADNAVNLLSFVFGILGDPVQRITQKIGV